MKGQKTRESWNSYLDVGEIKIMSKMNWFEVYLFFLNVHHFFIIFRYGGSPAIPRQVIRNHRGEIELELHPLSLKLYKHQTVPRSQANHVPTVVGGYSAAAIHATGGNVTDVFFWYHEIWSLLYIPPNFDKIFIFEKNYACK